MTSDADRQAQGYVRAGHCPKCNTLVVSIPDPPAVIETCRAPLFYNPPVYFEHTSQRCRDLRYQVNAAPT